MEPTEDEQALVQQAQGGNRQAFDQLVTTWRERLRAFVGSRLGARLKTQIEVDDVIQDATVRAYLAIKRFEWHGNDSFFHWLCSISEFVIRDLARSRKTVASALSYDISSGDPSPSKGVRREERFHRLMAAYDLLTSDHREALRLSRLEGLPVRDIAERMDRSESAVRHLILRALQKLRENFGKETESFSLPPRRLHGEGEKRVE